MVTISSTDTNSKVNDTELDIYIKGTTRRFTDAAVRLIEPVKTRRLPAPLSDANAIVRDDLLRRGTNMRTALRKPLICFGFEPVHARETTWLGRIVKGTEMEIGKILLPVRTLKEAWDVVHDNTGILVCFVNRLIPRFSHLSKEQITAVVKSEAHTVGLYWDGSLSSFATYAGMRMQRVPNLLRRLGSLVTFGYDRLDQISGFKAVVYEHPDISDAALARVLGISDVELLSLRDNAIRYNYSTYGSLSDVGNLFNGDIGETEDDSYRLQAVGNISDDLEAIADRNLKLERILLAIDKLPPKLRAFMYMRLGMKGDKEMSQTDIAATLGVSNAWAEQLEKKALRSISLLLRLEPTGISLEARTRKHRELAVSDETDISKRKKFGVCISDQQRSNGRKLAIVR